MAFTSKVKEKTLPFPNQIPMHDIWIGNVAAFFFNVHFLNKQLIYFRRHDNNSSSTATHSPHTIWTKITFRLQIAFSLIIKCFR